MCKYILWQSAKLGTIMLMDHHVEQFYSDAIACEQKQNWEITMIKFR